MAHDGLMTRALAPLPAPGLSKLDDAKPPRPDSDDLVWAFDALRQIDPWIDQHLASVAATARVDHFVDTMLLYGELHPAGSPVAPGDLILTDEVLPLRGRWHVVVDAAGPRPTKVLGPDDDRERWAITDPPGKVLASWRRWPATIIDPTCPMGTIWGPDLTRLRQVCSDTWEATCLGDHVADVFLAAFGARGGISAALEHLAPELQARKATDPLPAPGSVLFGRGDDNVGIVLGGGWCLWWKPFEWNLTTSPAATRYWTTPSIGPAGLGRPGEGHRVDGNSRYATATALARSMHSWVRALSDAHDPDPDKHTPSKKGPELPQPKRPPVGPQLPDFIRNGQRPIPTADVEPRPAAAKNPTVPSRLPGAVRGDLRAMLVTMAVTFVYNWGADRMTELRSRDALTTAEGLVAMATACDQVPAGQRFTFVARVTKTDDRHWGPIAEWVPTGEYRIANPGDPQAVTGLPTFGFVTATLIGTAKGPTDATAALQDLNAWARSDGAAAVDQLTAIAVDRADDPVTAPSGDAKLSKAKRDAIVRLLTGVHKIFTDHDDRDEHSADPERPADLAKVDDTAGELVDAPPPGDQPAPPLPWETPISLAAAGMQGTGAHPAADGDVKAFRVDGGDVTDDTPDPGGPYAPTMRRLTSLALTITTPPGGWPSPPPVPPHPAAGATSGSYRFDAAGLEDKVGTRLDADSPRHRMLQLLLAHIDADTKPALRREDSPLAALRTTWFMGRYRAHGEEVAAGDLLEVQCPEAPGGLFFAVPVATDRWVAAYGDKRADAKLVSCAPHGVIRSAWQPRTQPVFVDGHPFSDFWGSRGAALAELVDRVATEAAVTARDLLQLLTKRGGWDVDLFDSDDLVAHLWSELRRVGPSAPMWPGTVVIGRSGDVVGVAMADGTVLGTSPHSMILDRRDLRAAEPGWVWYPHRGNLPQSSTSASFG